MKRFISKNSMPETLDINTAKSLVYIGLIILTAYLIYFYVPAASFVLILVLFLQKKRKIENHLIKLAVIATLLPLFMNLFFGSLQQLLIIIFSGFASLRSGIHVDFSNPAYNFLFKSLSFFNVFLSCIAIATLFATLLLLNILFPIWKKNIRILSCFLISIPLIISVFFVLMLGIANIFNYFEFTSYLDSGVNQETRKLITNKKIDDFYIRAYRTDYQGALGAFGVEVEQEKDLPFYLKFVRDISSYYHCDTAQIDVLNNHTIRIKPNFDGHETNDDLKSPKIFYLKQFYTTKFLKFLNSKFKIN
ncbi:MAG: hypothetical protein H0W64_11000 [Gammaproteobacteria bacterium]|nr:hypothetical protein [Gammaproteobacteria bacterium]